MLLKTLQRRAFALCLLTAFLPALCRAADEPAVSKTIATAKADAVPAIAADDVQKNLVENSVVKIFSQVRRPELTKPWTKQSAQEATGSGIVIEGKRILTNAHVVLYSSQIQVQANQAGDKISATLEAIAPGIDLAVLKLEDESFFDTHPPLPRAATLPEIKDSVLVYGFPTGGTSLSITKGIVSRIEFARYNFPVGGLRIQIDAAINPGNSGGPALVGDKVIGLAFSHLSNAQNIGYIIPCEEIELFLQDVEDGRYDGKPALYDERQTLENPALRKFLHLEKAVEGAVIRRPFSTEPNYPLKQWDVVSKIGETKVDNEGMVKLGRNLRVHFTYLVQKEARNGTVSLSLVRDGKELKVEAPVRLENEQLIPYLRGAYPPYFIYGPAVFSIATEDLLQGISSNNSMGNYLSMIGSPLVTRRSEKPSFPGEQLVVIAAPFFPHKLVKGYGSLQMGVVQSINGVTIKNLAHLVEVLRDCRDEFIVIEVAGRSNESVVLPRAETMAATEEILTDNGVRAQGSPDVLKVWEAKPPAAAMAAETKPAAKSGDTPAKK
ncbi:MAG: trypsin-like peptidase domain-containing protein [Nibricoccus sp.]